MADYSEKTIVTTHYSENLLLVLIVIDVILSPAEHDVKSYFLDILPYSFKILDSNATETIKHTLLTNFTAKNCFLRFTMLNGHSCLLNY